MMKSRPKWVALGILVAMLIAAVAMLLHYRRGRTECKVTPELTCSIRFLTPEERVRESLRTDPFAVARDPPPPADQYDNPLLFSYWTLVIRVQNDTPAPWAMYDVYG